jgi:hypothetical protein
MISLEPIGRSIVFGSAISISILTFLNPSSAGKNKIAYICVIGSDVVIRDLDFKSIGRMSKGQCIKSSLNRDEPAGGKPSQMLHNGRWYYGIEMKNGERVGWVTSQFARIQYR